MHHFPNKTPRSFKNHKIMDHIRDLVLQVQIVREKITHFSSIR